jgi:flagellar protein FliO/FliZ
VDQILTPLLWFAVVVAAIPLALWLLKRSPVGGMAQGQGLRCVGVLPLSGTQRIVTVEVGRGEDRRWLVLGVTPGSITTLHTMAPQGEADAGAAVTMPATFADWLGRLRSGRGNADDSAPR